MKYQSITSMLKKNAHLCKSMLIAVFTGLTLLMVGSELKPIADLGEPNILNVYNTQIVQCGSTITPVINHIGEMTGASIQFQMRIENIGNSTEIFTIYADDYNGTGENPDGSSLENNINLTQELLDMNLNSINGELSLNPGETFDFILKLTLPLGNQYDIWNCTEIKAINNSCPENEGRAVVYTYIPVPEGVIIGLNQPILPTDNTSNESAFNDSLFIILSDLIHGIILA